MNKQPSLVSFFKLQLKRIPTTWLGFIVFVPGLTVAFIWGWVRTKMLVDHSKLVLDAIVGTVVMFLWGWLGVISITRREIPQLITIRGRPAILLGLAITIIFWGLGLYSLILGILEI